MAILMAWAMISLDCESPVPRNGWSEQWGPLVPHDTFPRDCGICHVPESWHILRADFSYDHEKETGFALVGAHARAACLRCHNDRGPVSVYVARSCGGCHPDPHKSQLGLDCTRCHDTTTWRPQGLISEHARTSFPLFGVHAATPCESCHLQAAVGDFRNAPLQCELCHSRDLARATSPDHAASGWIHRCERCHSPMGWGSANFSHAFFPLTAGHAGVACVACHTSGTFGPIPSDCYSCHRNDYQRAPDHVALGYPTDCTRCHTTAGWTGKSFNHSFFPLTGGHSGVACRGCHTSGSFTSIPTACNSCHNDDYQSAPNHPAQGYPTDCTQCHTVTSWRGVAVQHRFPLRGPHNVSCTTCHQGGSFAAFTCLVCHAHSQTSMDSKHRGRSGYSYNSEACYRCHPNGKGD